MSGLIAPSLVLLLIKTICVFLFCATAGWAVCTRKLFENNFIQLTFVLATGAALLNISVINASFWGFPGWYGLAIPAAVLLIRLSLVLKQGHGVLVVSRSARHLGAFAAICALAGSNYLLPFIVKGTSGYYARGGGDHNTYMALSDYFVSHRLYRKISVDEIIPPQPYWELNNFLRHRQNLHSGDAQPLANQYIATPFNALLPGSHEETYTAAVAFYVALAVWGTASLAGILMTLSHRRTLGVSALLALSNLLIYTASQQAIPFLFSIGLLNVLLCVFLNGIGQKPGGFRAAAVPSVLLGAALLLVYPHIFAFGVVLLAVMFAASKPKLRDLWKLAPLAAVTVVGAVLLTNIGLYITVPLVRSGATLAGSASLPYSNIQVVAVQSGGADFGMYLVPASPGNMFWVMTMGMVHVGIICLFVLCGLRPLRDPDRRAAFALALVYAGATAFYAHKNFSYQVIRFSEIGHLFYLSVAAVGIIAGLTSSRRYLVGLTWCGLAVCVVVFGGARLFTLLEVLGVVPSSQVEFRSSDALRMADFLAEKSQTPGGREFRWTMRNGQDYYYTLDASDELPPAAASTPVKANPPIPKWFGVGRHSYRVVYYFGPGFGVDLAGATLLLRRSAHLSAHGYDYSHIWDPYGSSKAPSVWSDTFLTNALLDVEPTPGGDVLRDYRTTAGSPKWQFGESRVYDTSVQDVAELVGPWWNAPLYQNGVPYRYLGGKTGALVIWSQTAQPITLSALLYADQDHASANLSGVALVHDLTLDVGRWQGVRDLKGAHVFQLNLRPGPNTLLLTPQGSGTIKPWLLVWDLSLCSNPRGSGCEGLSTLPAASNTYMKVVAWALRLEQQGEAFRDFITHHFSGF